MNYCPHIYCCYQKVLKFSVDYPDQHAPDPDEGWRAQQPHVNNINKIAKSWQLNWNAWMITNETFNH